MLFGQRMQSPPFEILGVEPLAVGQRRKEVLALVRSLSEAQAAVNARLARAAGDLGGGGVPEVHHTRGRRLVLRAAGSEPVALARAGAEIVLLPMENDFDGVPGFPPFHAADAVFRAAENRITIALGTVNGLSMVIDPFGRIRTEGQVNARGWNVGETFVANGTTPYTRHGDWFGWLMVVTLGSLIVVAASQRRRLVGKGYIRPQYEYADCSSRCFRP